MKDQETKEGFVELRAKGWSFDRIAQELRVSNQTLINWRREFALQISNLKAIELEALREKFFLLKEQQIEVFGERLKAVRDELDGRDLKDMSTEKLFDLLQKLYGHVGKDTGEVFFPEEEDGLTAMMAGNLKTP